MGEKEFKILKAVENIWGDIPEWRDTVNSMSYIKIFRIYRSAVKAGLINEEDTWKTVIEEEV